MMNRLFLLITLAFVVNVSYSQVIAKEETGNTEYLSDEIVDEELEKGMTIVGDGLAAL